MAIYRVVVKKTSSLQPNGNTFWNKEVLYCGTNLESARIAYLTSETKDGGGGSYGNQSIKTKIEKFESNPEEIDSVEANELEEEDA